MQNRGFPKAFTNNSNEKSHLGFLVLPFWQQQLFCRLVIFLSFHFQRLYDIPRQREDTNPNRWFSITWWDDRVGAQHNREWWLMVCIIIESDSHTSFFSFVLCTNLKAMTSGENHLLKASIPLQSEMKRPCHPSLPTSHDSLLWVLARNK